MVQIARRGFLMGLGATAALLKTGLSFAKPAPIDLQPLLLPGNHIVRIKDIVMSEGDVTEPGVRHLKIFRLEDTRPIMGFYWNSSGYLRWFSHGSDYDLALTKEYPIRLDAENCAGKPIIDINGTVDGLLFNAEFRFDEGKLVHKRVMTTAPPIFGAAPQEASLIERYDA